MSENSIIPSPPGSSLRIGQDPYPPAGAGTPPPPVNPLKMLHSFLRGHYLLLTVLLVVLAPIGGWLGYKCGRTEYRSAGVLHINPVLQKILYNTEATGQIPMFDEYMETERERIMSRRVIQLAISAPEWKAWKATLPDNLEDTIAEELQVTHSNGTGLLYVSVWDDNQTVARLAVQTVIHAYSQSYEEQRAADEAGTVSALQGRLNNEKADIERFKAAIAGIAANYMLGTDDLSKIQMDTQEELTKLNSYIAFAQGNTTTGGDPGVSGAAPISEDDAIAKTNPDMAEALRERNQIRRDLEVMKSDGFLDKNFTVQKSKNRLEVIDQEIEGYRSDFRKANGATAVAVVPSTQPSAKGAGLTSRPDPMNLAALKSQADRDRAYLAQIGRDMIRLQDFKDQRNKAQSDLNETQTRLDSLLLESGNSSKRLEVVSDGSASNSARDLKDTHVALAALGSGLGITISILAVALLSLSNRRFHGPEDTQYSQVRVPMLGMVPILNSDLTDPEQAAMAAHFVHGIRAALQLKTPIDGGRVIAITSPSPHNGKTSLSLALGVSFAGAHSKTLLIDCDFVGRALSSRVNAVAHPRLGRVLKHQGLVDEKSLKQALDSSVLKGKRLGESLLDMGVVSPEKLKAALEAQKNQAFGVLEAIDGEDLAECVAPTDIPGLSILPLGQANAEHIGSLSPAMLRQVLETCRSKYDVIIVDTGPILGSLEAAMVATQADDVVVVLSSGENRSAAERSLRYLDSVGAKVAGFVFNRAATRDFERSDSASRVSSSANRWAHAKNWTHSTQLAAFGPVAQAVARSVGEAHGGGKANGNGNGNGNGSANGNGARNGNSNGHSRYGQNANGESHFS
jgi:Mrp family chromosome partitioning ATPase